eukprot:scaffold18052_cov28-Tisochrysis_lutea.AAC.4
MAGRQARGWHATALRARGGRESPAASTPRFAPCQWRPRGPERAVTGGWRRRVRRAAGGGVAHLEGAERRAAHKGDVVAREVMQRQELADLRSLHAGCQQGKTPTRRGSQTRAYLHFDEL